MATSNVAGIMVECTPDLGAGRFAYASDDVAGTIAAYRASASTGALEAIAAPLASGGSGTCALKVDPSGRVLYAANAATASISGFTIDADTGALTPVPGSPYALGSQPVQPVSLAFDATGQYLYVGMSSSLGGLGNAVAAFRINASNGALSEVPGSPFSADYGTNPWLRGIAVAGNHLYFTNASADSQGGTGIIVMTIDSLTGALARTSMASTGILPHTLSVEPSGRYAFVTGNNDPYHSLTTYTINPLDGALKPLASAPAVIFNLNGQASIDPKGHFMLAPIYSWLAGSNGVPRGVAVLPIDLATGTVDTTPANTPQFVDSVPSWAVANPLGSFVYVGPPMFALAFNDYSGMTGPAVQVSPDPACAIAFD